MDGIELLNFKDLYEITVERKVEKKIGYKDEKTKDIILSYYELKEDE